MDMYEWHIYGLIIATCWALFTAECMMKRYCFHELLKQVTDVLSSEKTHGKRHFCYWVYGFVPKNIVG